MPRLETKTLRVAPREADASLRLYWSAWWDLKSSQEIFHEYQRLETDADGDLVRKTDVTNYTTLVLQRDWDNPRVATYGQMENRLGELQGGKNEHKRVAPAKPSLVGPVWLIVLMGFFGLTTVFQGLAGLAFSSLFWAGLIAGVFWAKKRLAMRPAWSVRMQELGVVLQQYDQEIARVRAQLGGLARR